MKGTRKERSKEIDTDVLNSSKGVRRRSFPLSRKSLQSKSEVKRKHWKQLKDKNAPKKPHTAYVLFLATQKRSQTKGNDTSFSEHMSIIGRRWNALSDEQKRPFLEKAEAERVEYEKQMEAYRKTDAYKQFTEKKEEILKKRRRKLKSGEPDSDDENEKLMGRTQAADLPIFSAQFLEYNKTQEAALKKLRQKSSSLEEENRLLKEIISRLKANIVAKKREYQKESGRAQEVLRTKEKWTSLIVAALNGVVVSGAPPVAKNIYAYMERLNYLTMEDPQHPILIKVRMALAGSSFL